MKKKQEIKDQIKRLEEKERTTDLDFVQEKCLNQIVILEWVLS